VLTQAHREGEKIEVFVSREFQGTHAAAIRGFRAARDCLHGARFSSV
jgi:hypothetical protein